MSDDLAAQQQQLIAELKVTAHLMTLDAGVYCVYAGADSPAPDPATGLPAVRLTVPPGLLGHSMTITSIREDGWMGAADAVSLIRVARGPAQILITVYQLPDSPQEPPRLQVTRLVEGVSGGSPEPLAVQAPLAAAARSADESTVTGGEKAPPVGEPEIVAHMQMRGDIAAQIGEWVGDPGSQRWIEGFAMAPRSELDGEDIEYQAVLGRGWLSPWAEGGQYCGSRGMALPILGLRVRLRGEAAETHRVEVRATFTDGTEIGPLGSGDACEAESLAPLEAFQVTIVALEDGAAAVAPVRRGKPQPLPTPTPSPRSKPAAKAVAPKAAVPKAAASKPKPAPAKVAAPVKAPARPVAPTRAPAKPTGGKRR